MKLNDLREVLGIKYINICKINKDETLTIKDRINYDKYRWVMPKSYLKINESIIDKFDTMYEKYGEYRVIEMVEDIDNTITIIVEK